MQIRDKNGQTLDVDREWHRAKLARLTINKGRPDERDVLLDADGVRALVKELTDTL